MIAGVMALWGAVVWRMRGGAFAAVTGVDIGTNATRAVCGLFLAAPLAWLARDPWLLLVAPAIAVGLMCVGWGPFMAYALDNNNHVRASPFDMLPRVLGVPQASRWTDALAWLEMGPLCMAPAALLLWWRGYFWWWLAAPAAAFAGVYFVCDAAGERGWLPSWRAIDTPEAWAELAMGALVGAGLALAVLRIW